MLRSLFRSKKPDTSSVYRPALPEGLRAYSIGDIHGRDDLFAELLNLIEKDNAGRPDADCALVLLGDLVDRGPSSAAVIDRAIAQKKLWSTFHWLTGNHEEVFLKALAGDLPALKFFCRIGGEETILSYGIDRMDYSRMTYEELSRALISAVPAAHLDFLETGEEMIILGDYAFVHAGVRPGVPLGSQKSADLRWIREPFLSASENFGRFVVHGHTITSAIDERPNRLGIDTGAYVSGKLTAAAFEGAERWFLSTGQ